MNPKIIFGKAFFLGHNARTVKRASTNRRKRAYAQVFSPFFAARKCSSRSLRNAFLTWQKQKVSPLR